jgi:hypothetical protein
MTLEIKMTTTLDRAAGKMESIEGRRQTSRLPVFSDRYF